MFSGVGNTTRDPPGQVLALYLQYVGLVASQLLTVAGNLIVLLSFYVDPLLRKPKYYYIFSMAAADLIVGVFSMPIYSLYLMLGYWPFTTTACDVWLSIDYACCEVSVLHLIMISVDRLWSIKNPIQYRSAMNSSKAIATIAAGWVIPFIAYFVVIFGWPYYGRGSRPTVECYVPFLIESPLCVTLLTAFAYWIPTAIIWTIYANIYFTVVVKVDNELERSRSRRCVGEKAARKTLTLIIGVFFTTWSPYSLVVIILSYHPYSIPTSIYHFCYYLCYINSTLNPVCYALSIVRFKRAFQTLLCTKKNEIHKWTIRPR